jgi:hypothetical protein
VKKKMFTAELRISYSNVVLTGTCELAGQIVNVPCVLIRDS